MLLARAGCWGWLSPGLSRRPHVRWRQGLEPAACSPKLPVLAFLNQRSRCFQGPVGDGPASPGRLSCLVGLGRESLSALLSLQAQKGLQVESLSRMG